ncbi:MAG: hypothetical protein EZS28_002560 [Streblomastix strix]|uniref:Uncharacterized protein n=1 Tax=Streblomastix strix TaxID=222440 RepID=A0A5J4X576_9EUKA|nr:MAG: hypothetical protein EZS28_002560 [Streblomastix strix]
MVRDSQLMTEFIVDRNSSSSSSQLSGSEYQLTVDDLRISRTVESTGSAEIQLGCSKTANTGKIAVQWAISSPPSNYFNNPLGFIIVLTPDASDASRGLRISEDGNTLSFNGSVIAGIGTTGSASSGSVNYSAGNALLWDINSFGTEGGFYSDGAKIYRRAKPITLGSIPP